jgi:NhaA family Na+:H+ antiporter
VPERRTSPPPWHPLAWADALTQFGRTEQAGGVLLAVALAAALLWANLAGHSYATIWSHSAAGLDSALHTQGLRTVSDLVDSGLMTIFFLAVGIEIGREIAEGSLRDRRNALLPVVAALCGMAGAAALYLLTVAALPHSGGIAKGWGIPMATDVAFTLGAVALLGSRVPRPLRIFVLALAVADDIASVIVLAIVASQRPKLGWLLAAVLLFVALVVMRRYIRHAWWPYALATAGAWYLFNRAGIEPPLAGAFVGLLIPIARGARAGRRLEGPTHTISSYAVLPVFVLANAGVTVTAALWRSDNAVSVLGAVITARTLGKMLGITLGTFLLIRLGICNLPEATRWRHVVGVSLLCGMGITVPLLFAHSVFGGGSTRYDGAPVGLILGTLAAAILGAAVLLSGRSTAQPDIGRDTVPAAGDPDPEPAHDSHKEG